MKTAEQKRFPQLHRVNRACSRKLEQAAKAILAAREILREVGEGEQFTSQEKDAARSKVTVLIGLWAKVSNESKFDPCVSAAHWTDRDEEAQAAKAKGAA